MSTAPGVVLAASRRSPPTICLNMIVRNEAHVIRQAFDSVLPYLATWVIVDTGSTDETQSVIADYFRTRGVPGELHERPWRDFGTNRTDAIALARGKADYIWVLDADDLVVGAPDLSALTLDCYHLRFGPDFIYWRAQIFRGDRAWAYRGVVHEYAVALDPPFTEGRLEGDYHVESRRLGDRNRSADKYARDRRLLEAYLADHPDDARSIFYLAQSCFDAGDVRSALEHYERRAELGGWDEETYYALFRRAVCLERLGEPWMVCQEAYEAAARFRPGRAEPLHSLARFHRVAGRYEEAHAAAREACAIPWPEHDRLFVAADVYRWQSADERAIAAYYTGRYDESIELCARLLDNPHLPDADRDRVTRNRDVAVERTLDREPPYPADIVARLTAKREHANTLRGQSTDDTSEVLPRVTLTMTTCKRRHLFERTVNSFLACCEDVEAIDRWIVVDDGSSEEDRAWMADRYPFFEYAWKSPEEKGHARSMNLILDRIDSPYWLHLEDDWRFVVRDRYVAKAIAVLDEDPSIGQVLFNRNYGETLADRDIAGGAVVHTCGGVRYRVHEHAAPGTSAHAEALARHPAGSFNVLYWPHYSLRPSIARVDAIRGVGRFDPGASHFEQDFAARYAAAGHRSAFLDAIHCLHIGKLTSERGVAAPPNAYALNNEPQFVTRSARPPRRVRIAGTGAARHPWRRQARADGGWDDVVFVGEGEDADYFAVMGDPGDEPIDATRSIAFALSPGDVRPIDARAFIQVRCRGAYPPIGTWRIDRSWEELASRPVPKERTISARRASRVGSAGDRLSRRLLDELGARGLNVPVHDPGDASGLLPFRYAVVVEDESRPDHITEAFFDALVSECLCFYWGCPNLEAYVDPAVFIRLPIEDVDASLRVIDDAIGRDAHGGRIDAIRREKRRFLNERQFVPTLARAIRGHEIASSLPVLVINLDRRPDRWTAFTRAAVKAAGVFAARCERISAVDGRTIALTPEIRHLFRGNDFGYRNGIVGCALSHLAIWRRVAASDALTLVLEDDARFDEHFTGQLADVCGEIDARDGEVDLVLIGYQTWTREQRAALAACRGPRLRAMDWSRFLGGSFGYLVSPRGARTLLAFAERDGIQQGIDWFVMRKAERLAVLQAAPPLVTAPLAVRGGPVDSDIQHDTAPVARVPSARRDGPDTVRVKLIGDWCPPEALCRDWDRMSQGGFRWNDIEITWQDQDIDFYVIINKPWPGEHYEPARTIVFQMEPWCGLPHQTWGVKTWGEWAAPDPARFLQVRRHASHVNVAFWQLRSTYAELGAMTFEKTRLLSTICSAKYFDPGHIARVDFIKYIDRRKDDVVRLDTFGYTNPLGFESYRGPLPVDYKEAGLAPYKYTFLAENNRERNFITEKLWEPLLTETLCFYAGCPNAADYVDPDAFVALDLSDFERAFDVMKQAIAADEWSRRIAAIRREKRRVLEQHQFFPTLERTLLHELRMPRRPTDDEVIYHKYFHAVAGRDIRTAAFVHSYTPAGGDTRALRRVLDAVAASGLIARLDCLYVVNVGAAIGAGDLGIAGAAANVHVINDSPDAARYERPTLDLVRRFARVHASSRLLYLHTKGASYDPPHRHIDDWIACMLYFVVEHHEACLAALADHDVVGCNRRERPSPHFSGNFWWATARHVASLPPVPPGDRYESEWWILGRTGTSSLSLWDSGIDHYREPCPRKRYDTAAVRDALRSRAVAATRHGRSC